MSKVRLRLTFKGGYFGIVAAMTKNIHKKLAQLGYWCGSLRLVNKLEFIS